MKVAKVGGEGLGENGVTACRTSNLHNLAEQSDAHIGAPNLEMAQSDTELDWLIKVWPALPQEARAVILATAKAGAEVVQG